jgi:hypothetical protein
MQVGKVLVAAGEQPPSDAKGRLRGLLKNAPPDAVVFAASPASFKTASRTAEVRT